jgi:hypothetical protein
MKSLTTPLGTSLWAEMDLDDLISLASVRPEGVGAEGVPVRERIARACGRRRGSRDSLCTVGGEKGARHSAEQEAGKTGLIYAAQPGGPGKKRIRAIQASEYVIRWSLLASSAQGADSRVPEEGDDPSLRSPAAATGHSSHQRAEMTRPPLRIGILLPASLKIRGN